MLDDWYEIVACLLPLIVIIGLLGGKWFLLSRRKSQLVSWASREGLNLDLTNNEGPNEDYSMFHCLQRGFLRQLQQTSHGKYEGRQVILMQMKYRTLSLVVFPWTTKLIQAIIMSSHSPMKPLVVRPRTPSEKASIAVDIESLSVGPLQFQMKYSVLGVSVEAAENVLQPHVIDRLMNVRNVYIEVDLHKAIACQEVGLRCAEVEELIGILSSVVSSSER